jgi:WD40 repeat protein
MSESIIEIEEINEDDNEQIVKIDEFLLFQDRFIYKIVIAESLDNIHLKYKKYEKKLNFEDFNSLFRIRVNSIHDCFVYITNLFEDNKASIKSFNAKRTIKLSFNINYDDSNSVNVDLDYDEDTSGGMLEKLNNRCNRLLKNYRDLKKELISLKKEQKSIKLIQNNENPKNIKFSADIAKDSFAGYSYGDSFTVFRSINNILQIVYATKNKSIFCYDLDKKSIIHKLFNAHKNYITSFRHFLDPDIRRDIIMSISKKDNNIRLWNANNWESICSIENVNKNDFLYSACFLKDVNDNFIITSNGCNRQYYMSMQNFERLKCYNFAGVNVKELNNSDDCTFFIDTYYDEKLSKNFIITGNFNYIKSYDYDNNQVYHKYYENNNGIHPSVIIKKNEEKIKLIESCEDGIIRMWEFHSGNLLRKIKTDNDNLYGICLWNDNYAFIGCRDQTIKLIELKNGLLIKTIKGHKGRIISFKKIKEPNIGEFLFSQGLDQTIKLWKNE